MPQDNDLRHTLLCMEQAALASMKRDDSEAKEKASLVRPVPVFPQTDPREEIKAQRKKVNLYHFISAKFSIMQKFIFLQLAELKRASKRSLFWDGEDTAQQSSDYSSTAQFQMPEIQWVESATETGEPYYWNIYTGGSFRTFMSY